MAGAGAISPLLLLVLLLPDAGGGAEEKAGEGAMGTVSTHRVKEPQRWTCAWSGG